MKKEMGVPANCVDAEKLAAWISGALSAHEAGEVELHLSNCARCQTMMAVFARTEPVLPVLPMNVPFWKRWLTSPRGWLVPLTAAAVAVLIWVAWPMQEPAQLPSQTIALQLAPGTPAVLSRIDEPAAAPLAAAAPPAAPKPKSSVKGPAAGLSGKAVSEPPAPRGVVADAVSAATQAQRPAPPPPPPAGPPPPVAVAAVSPPPIITLLAGLAEAAAVIEFSSPDPALLAQPVAGASGGGGGRGAAGGRGGGGAAITRSQIRWRLSFPGKVERSANNGVSWETISVGPPVTFTGGVAPSASVCWLIGQGGVVLRTTDSVRFERVPFPETVDLRSIRATSARDVTVTTVDGSVFTTTDGGITWTKSSLLQGFGPCPF